MNRFPAKWMDDAWSLIADTLFVPETGLVYDYVGSAGKIGRFAHLPSVEEIAAGFPNPCGWGTGMEDCALNGGFLLDILSRARLEKSEFAGEAAAGLMRCASCHGRRGFVARGISPADGRSCYENSSRDQFTLAVYGMWSFLNRGGVPDSLASGGCDFLCSVADYCEKTVTAENGYDLLRLDGRHAVVSKMRHCLSHEALRLPMIYGAAAAISGKRKYFDWMNEILEEALTETMKFNPDGDWWDMPVIQMQLSLDFFRRSRIAPQAVERVELVEQRAAMLASRELPRLLDAAENYGGNWYEPCGNWRRLPMVLRGETLSDGGGSALFGGRSYLLPQLPATYTRPNELLRGLGNYLGTLALAPENGGVEEFAARLDRFCASLDLSHFCGVGVVPLLFGRLAAADFGADGFAMASRLQKHVENVCKKEGVLP